MGTESAGGKFTDAMIWAIFGGIVAAIVVLLVVTCWRLKRRCLQGRAQVEQDYISISDTTEGSLAFIESNKGVPKVCSRNSSTVTPHFKV